VKRTGIVLAGSLPLILAVAHAQDSGKKTPDTPVPAGQAPGGDASKDATAKKGDAAKSPDPGKATPAGDVLAAGSVSREKLFPLEDGRTWRYELKQWIATTSAEEGQPEDTEPPRVHRLDVSTGEGLKIDGKDARCLEWRLDDEPAQKAYYFDNVDSILCARRILGAGEHAHEYTLTPPQPVITGDLVVGATWTWTGKVGPSSGKQQFQVLREEKVKAGPLGELGCVVIRMNFTGDDDSTGVSVKWLSPGVGLVREETEVKAESQVYRTLGVLTKFEKGKK
jgi:hypothetical protein